jgi:hypothetical protein
MDKKEKKALDDWIQREDISFFDEGEEKECHACNCYYPQEDTTYCSSCGKCTCWECIDDETNICFMCGLTME